MRASLGTLAAFLLALGLIGASLPALAGSQGSPEVEDPAGDVQGSLATGAGIGAESWADITAVWYDQETMSEFRVSVEVVELPPAQDQGLPGQPSVTYTLTFLLHSVSAEDVPGFEENLFLNNTVTFTPAVNAPASEDSCTAGPTGGSSVDGNVSRGGDNTFISCTVPKSVVAPPSRNSSVYQGDMAMNHTIDSEVTVSGDTLTDFASDNSAEAFWFFQQYRDRPEPVEDDDGDDGANGDGGDGGGGDGGDQSTPGFEAALLVGALAAVAWAVRRRRR